MRSLTVLSVIALALCGVIVVPIPAYAGTCKEGYVWVSTVKNESSGNNAKIWYGKKKDTGYCKKLDPKLVTDDAATSDSQTTSDPRRFCLLEGVTKEERDGSFLMINGERWLVCPITPTGAVTPSLDVAAVARSLAVRLRLPDATPIFGPNPNRNEWKMLAVGFPVGLTTAGPRHRATTASASGLTFRLNAELTSTTFAMGDGTRITCTAMTPYTDSVKAGSPSPTCGHTYTKPSLPKGPYTVTATANWTISWSVDGIAGSFPMSYSDSAQLPIGELTALNR